MVWHRVAESGQIEEGGSLEVVIHGEVIAVFRYESGLHAIEGICAHQGGPLAAGRVADGCVTCPWHGWQYELRNGYHAASCRPMLRTYAIREENGVIEIEYR